MRTDSICGQAWLSGSISCFLVLGQ